MNKDRRRRRSKCNNCGAKFTTYEVYATEMKLMNRIKDAVFTYEEENAD